MKSVLRVLLRGYKRWISPLLPHACRFVPTCSEYALEAVELHGAVRGTGLAMARLLRCHPFARAGHDPVPAPRSEVGQRCAHVGCVPCGVASSTIRHGLERNLG